jgi:general secretion pathway protein A
MTLSGTRNYIRTRLRLAGVRDLGIFTEEALARISTQTGGIPRVVNTVCDHCLLIGYADQTRRIDADIVDQALSYLHGGAAVRTRRRTREVSRPRIVRRRARRRMSPLAWGVLGASTAVVAAVAAVIWTHPGFVTEALDLSSAQLSDLARSLRSLIGQ